MAELTPQDMAAKLLTTGFERSGPSAAALMSTVTAADGFCRRDGQAA